MPIISGYNAGRLDGMRALIAMLPPALRTRVKLWILRQSIKRLTAALVGAGDAAEVASHSLYKFGQVLSRIELHKAKPA